MDYKNTLNLPKTDFPMKADLPKREPEMLARWQKEKLYEQIIAKRAKGKKFVLHNGPPFVNGDAHMGHALNFTLKDIVLKYKNMTGHFVPFIPGWDCHGLPIEHKVAKELGEEVTDPVLIRKKCDEMARKYIKIQGDQFQRLGMFGDWENPYRTLDPEYEADELRGIATMIDKKLIYEGFRPVLWSTGCKTALAEAEIEYKEKTDLAVYAKFKLTPESVKKLGHTGDVSLLIWTTTPWTLPANLAVAVGEKFKYAVWNVGGEKVIYSHNAELAAKIPKSAGAKVEGEPFDGKKLDGLEYAHPFITSRIGIIRPADFVTEQDGTGLVHIAPGHGPDDYFFGQQYGLPALSPVDDRGCITAESETPELVGQYVFKANPLVADILERVGALWEKHEFQHDYPHCWRSKTPIVFRAVKQWFIKVDAFRAAALKAIDKVQWIPDWGKKRIYGSVESRPDWCISRQRTWGVPIPVFYDAQGVPTLTEELVRKFADIVEKEGTNVWFATNDEDMAKRLGLPKGLRKGKDTLDVWIDSGHSHAAVLRGTKFAKVLYRDGIDDKNDWRADLYLEGSDQHRGWFQSSLMTSVAECGEPPYKEVLTNGFVVDGYGKKLSKSAGGSDKPTDLMTLVDRYGADVLRLWVASQDYSDDVPFSEEIFARVADSYRAVRNTLRILLANLYDYKPEMAVPRAQWTEIDLYIHAKFQELVKVVLDSYKNYKFYEIYQAINLFCTVDLSALYVDVLKDRMYCDAANDPKRRASQTVMYEIVESLAKLLAPITSYTAEETWQFLGHQDSVHLQLLPEVKADGKVDAAFMTRWSEILRVRALGNEQIEKLRQTKEIGKSLEAMLYIEDAVLTEADALLLEETCLVSKVVIAPSKNAEVPVIRATKATGGKCARCWKVREEVDDKHPLCLRCASVVSALKT